MSRVWRAHGLKPHLIRPFKVSHDPRFAEELEDVIGLYLNAREHALVLCYDEKSQVQAMGHTQPSPPLKNGRAGQVTHDYVWHGTTTLSAALNVADGTSGEFIRQTPLRPTAATHEISNLMRPQKAVPVHHAKNLRISRGHLAASKVVCAPKARMTGGSHPRILTCDRE